MRNCQSFEGVDDNFDNGSHFLGFVIELKVWSQFRRMSRFRGFVTAFWDLSQFPKMSHL